MTEATCEHQWLEIGEGIDRCYTCGEIRDRQEPQEDEEMCDHEWRIYDSGATRCRYCGVYKLTDDPASQDSQPWYREATPKPDDRMIALLELIEQNTRQQPVINVSPAVDAEAPPSDQYVKMEDYRHLEELWARQCNITSNLVEALKPYLSSEDIERIASKERT